MNEVTLGFAMCGSFCTFHAVLQQLQRLRERFAHIIPIMSENSYTTDTRFGSAAEFRQAMEDICGLLTYINGQLDDESDDLIDDSALYFMFVRLAARVRELDEPAERDRILDEMLTDYQEPVPGARERVEKVLRIMMTAWAASQLRQTAENMVKELKGEQE